MTSGDSSRDGYVARRHERAGAEYGKPPLLRIRESPTRRGIFPLSIQGFPQWNRTPSSPTLVLHLPGVGGHHEASQRGSADTALELGLDLAASGLGTTSPAAARRPRGDHYLPGRRDRKSTRLNSSHVSISYAVFCLKKKKKKIYIIYPNKKNTINKLIR